MQKDEHIKYRGDLASAVELYAEGSIDSDLLDDVVMSAPAKAVDLPILMGIWVTYDDLRTHRVNPGLHVQAYLRRIAAFLRSGRDYQRPTVRRKGLFRLLRHRGNSYWPFASQKEWLAYRGLTTIPAPPGELSPKLIRLYRR